MKKLLNPKLNTEGITMIDTSCSDEKLESSKCERKGKKPLKTEEDSSLTETKFSAVFLEIRGKLLREQQKDETYLLEEDKLTDIDKTRVGTKKEFYSQEDRIAIPKKKKLKVKEFSSVIHQGKILKMVGELAPGWRPPKTN